MHNTFILPFYKFNLLSNIDLNTYPAPLNTQSKTIFLNAVKGNSVLDENINFNINDGIFTINSPFSSYYISKNNITAKYNTINDIKSTLYNLPASVISIYHSDLLLHASGLSIDNNIVAFCAPKGGGKTTLISYIAKVFNFFSDDTIYLENENNQINCYAGLDELKLTEETLYHHDNGYDIYMNSKKNIQEKAYVKANDINLLTSDKNCITKPYKLSKIFFIKRSENQGFKTKDIININEKKSLLIANIVGSKYLPHDWIFKIFNSSIFNNIISKIEFKYLFIFNNIEYLRLNIRELSELIKI